MSSKSQKKGLGRGLDSLISSETIRDQLHQADATQRVQQIPVTKIKANPYQPRKHFNQEKIDSLAASLDAHGLLQPIVVIRKNDEFQLIAGERRLRASQKLGWQEISALVRSEQEQSQLELALIENIQRDDLNPLDVGQAYIQLVEEFDQPIETVSQRTGRAASTIKNTIRLLSLPNKAKEALRSEEISEGHARQILAFKDESKQLELLSLIKKHGWSVRQAERFTKAYKEEGAQKSKAIKRVLSESPFTKKLSEKLNTAVKIQNMAKGGRVVIEFKNDDELRRIEDILN